MSGFEHYRDELANLDHEIAHYAMACGVDLGDRAAIDYCLAHPHASWAEDKARQTLRGLLILRIKLETEMLEQGIDPNTLPQTGTRAEDEEKPSPPRQS